MSDTQPTENTPATKNDTAPAIKEPKKRNSLSGSTSDDFTNVVGSQALHAMWTANSDKSGQKAQTEAVIVALRGIKPQDEIEGMLASQMIATHFAAMRCMRALKNSDSIPQQDSNGNIAIKLLRTYTAQIEALQRYRGKGQQKMTVEHVHVHSGGQAIVGTVSSTKVINQAGGEG